MPPTDSALADKIKNAPQLPGCYLYRDRYGNVIYVGKAKNLRSRVKSYFVPSALADERVQELLPRIADVEFLALNSELDALLQEYRLIKRWKPWFNAQMKPDKVRPFLRVAHAGLYPAMSPAAARAADGAAYYDFFSDEEEVRGTLALLAGVWRTARCGREDFGRRSGPCLYHALGGCLAPCAHLPAREGYAAAVAEIERLLDGKRVPRLLALRREMETHAESLAFEKAAACKEQLAALERLRAKSRRMNHLPDKGRVMVLVRPFRQAGFTAFYARDGAVLARQDFAEPPALEQAQVLLSGWKAAQAPLADSPWLAPCLAAISADKAFVRLTGRATAGQVLREMERYCAGR